MCFFLSSEFSNATSAMVQQNLQTTYTPIKDQPANV